MMSLIHSLDLTYSPSRCLWQLRPSQQRLRPPPPPPPPPQLRHRAVGLAQSTPMETPEPPFAMRVRLRLTRLVLLSMRPSRLSLFAALCNLVVIVMIRCAPEEDRHARPVVKDGRTSDATSRAGGAQGRVSVSKRFCM
jgi:hypothetical protein